MDIGFKLGIMFSMFFIFASVMPMVRCDLKHSAIFRVRPQPGHELQDVASDLMQCALQLLDIGEPYGKMTSDPATCSNGWYDGGSTFMAYYNGTTGFGNDVGAGASYLAQQFDKIVHYDPPVRDDLRWKYDYFCGQCYSDIL